MPNRYRAGQPAELPIPPIEYTDDETDEGMGMLAYMIIALVLVWGAIVIGFIFGRYFA